MKISYYLLKIFNRLFSKNKGENNIIKVDKEINLKYVIEGKNNLVEIFSGGVKRLILP